MEGSHRLDRLEKLVRFAAKSPSEKQSCKIQAYHGETTYIVSSLIHRVLLLKNPSLLSEISRDSWALYSHVKDETAMDEPGDHVSTLINECLVKLVKMQPIKSYLKLSFHQYINFILSKGSNDLLLDVDHFMSFINELHKSYDTLCLEDRRTMRQIWKTIECDSFASKFAGDAGFLSNWSTIEAAKYCICHKFAPDMSANEFLTLLQKEISSPVCLANKVSRQYLVNFTHVLDKYILDRISESSTGKHTFSASDSVEKFYAANSSIFKSWLSKNRQNISRLCLSIDDPAECLRNISLKMCSDMSSSCRSLSISPTLMSLKSQNWNSNLSLLIESAKQLHDASLLYGLRNLIGSEKIICNHPIVDAVISNLGGHFQKTHDTLLDSRIEITEQNLIEFLNSCIELGVLDENVHYADKLTSPRKRDLYKNYSRSRARDSLTPLRLEELDQWLSSWSDINNPEQQADFETLSIKSCLDLIVPTCLNIISKEPVIKRSSIIERTEMLISQDFIAQCLFTPNVFNKNSKIFHVLIEILKGNNAISEGLIQTHAKDLYWNHSLYRHLCDLDMIEKLKDSTSSIELVQYRAARFNFKHSNLNLASKIAEDLRQRASSCEIKLLSSLLLATSVEPSNDKYDALTDLVKEIENSDIEDRIKTDLVSKAVRRMLISGDRSKSSKRSNETSKPSSLNTHDYLEHAVADFELPENWRSRIESSSLDSKIQTYLLLSKQLNMQSELDLNNDALLNMTFCLDFDLLGLLSQSSHQKHKSCKLECATRVLSMIQSNHRRLDRANLDRFTTEGFIVNTLRVWIALKSNIIALIFDQDNLTSDWSTALLNILKMMVKSYPNLLIYTILMNRLDFKNEISRISSSDYDSSLHQTPQELCSLLAKSSLAESNIKDQTSSYRKLRSSQQKLAIWNELLDQIKSPRFEEKSRWLNIIEDTELFLKELRKISFLSGEYMRTLTNTIPKKLNACLRYFSKFCDPKTGTILDDKQRLQVCEKRFRLDCDYAIKSIKSLLSYGEKVKESNQTLYDVWFYNTFTKQLTELDYRLNLLAKKKSLVLNELELLVRSITELLKMCRTTLMEYNRNNRQQVYMEMVSPLLSRLNLNNIPMPDCCDQQLTNPMRPIVTISKISQTVHLIHSKTCPKKLKFLGSDGTARSFLLKAHEDLRLDQFIMELFACVNELLINNKETAAHSAYRIRRYSVTPISSQSGLIQWIDAPSLCSTYRAWLSGSNGKKMIDDFYSSTCHALCDEPESLMPRASHKNCQPPPDCQLVDLFYQLLWAKTKSVKHPIGENKPSVNNCLEYRLLFDSAVFQGVVEQLSERSPKELFSNHLWYKSNNAHSFWLKTQKFINSCATMSIVGYIIGLGDRHLENMLLDCNTGEIIHIDYNICFELGKSLSIPERVPFRLTQNMIHAFGFAGLEGGFTLSCRNVLNALRERKSTLLHLVDKVNLNFLQIRGSKVTFDANLGKFSNHHLKPNSVISPTQQAPPAGYSKSTTTRLHDDLEMCSQESVELKPPVNNVTDLLIMNHHSLPKKVELHQTFEKIRPKPFSSASPPSDSQHNIELAAAADDDEPIKLASVVQVRIGDKLAGTDECLRHYKYNRQFCNVNNSFGAQSKQEEEEPPNDKAGDLIVLNDAQSVEEQVDALIMEASSIRNRAKMFEGWLPWI